MKVSPHTHAESPLTGSTLSTMVKRAKELGRTHFAYTDHGHLSSALKAYKAAKENGLKFIPGIEIFFRDASCPYISNTQADRCKYFTATLYCKDQDTYQELCKMVSRTDFATMDMYEEKQQLWSWKDLEHMSKLNTEIVVGGIHCIVAKPMLAGRADVGEKILIQLKALFGSRLSVAIVAESWSRKWNNVVEVKYTDGTKDQLLSGDTVNTDRARKLKALDLAEHASRHSVIKSKSVGTMHSDVNKNVQSIKLHKGFLPLPGGDAMTKVNRFLKALANKHGLTILVSDYAYYAKQEDKIVQTMRLEGNNKLQPNFHMKNVQEVGDYLTKVMGYNPADVTNLLDNNEEWAKKFDNFSLSFKWRLATAEGSALQKAMAIVKENGRMKWDDPKYVARLKEELAVIHGNGVYDLSPYFLPIRDVLEEYRKNGLLTGPGRGSAGGSLLCYLMGITEVDPFDYDLPFQRFFSMVRIKSKKLPDIDVDLEGREFLVGEDGHSGYLYGRWGDKAAQISTRTTIRLKSAILDTNRYFKGKVEDSIATLSKGLPAPPQGVTDHQFVFGYEDNDVHVPGLIELSAELQKYAVERPEEWDIVSKAMGLTRAYSKHASAFVISDVPIKDVIPTKDGNVTQYEAKEVEEAGLIKYDFLVVKQLKDIRVCMDLIKKKAGVTDMDVKHFPHNGEKTRIWKLPKDPEVFEAIWDGQTETMFQINTASMRPHVIDMKPKNIMDLATLLALVRPGPLDFIDPNTGRNMVEEYMLRRRGESQPDIKEMADLLPSTYGILAFQEQLGIIARDLAGFPGEEAELLRENMAKKKMVALTKMKPAFIEGALKKVSPEIAEGIWDRMVTFGRYGFSVIHAVEYALITHACMFLKYHYPLEWWAAILTNATEQEITGKFWPFVKDFVSPPDINLSGDTMAVDYANGKIRSKMGIIRGMGEKTIDPIVNSRPYKDIQDFVNKEVAGPSLSHKLIHVGVLDSLFPPRTNLLEKLKMFEDAVENKKYMEKVAKAEVNGKKVRTLAPKGGTIPEEYVNIHPVKDAAMRKAVLPSLPIDLFALGAKYSKVLAPFEDRPMVISKNGYRTLLLSGEQLRRLDETPGENIEEDIYVAATCFVIEAKEFAYSKNTKRALKMILDADGYVSEKVLWPEYESGQLVYASGMKKGAIVTVFFRKKAGRKDMSVMNIVVES